MIWVTKLLIQLILTILEYYIKLSLISGFIFGFFGFLLGISFGYINGMTIIKTNYNYDIINNFYDIFVDYLNVACYKIVICWSIFFVCGLLLPFILLFVMYSQIKIFIKKYFFDQISNYCD